MKTPLERPELPSIDRRIRWERSVAIFGSGAQAFAERMAKGRGIRVLRVELRHAEGFDVSGDVIRTSPDALLAAIEALPRDTPVIGVGSAFAATVDADLLVYLRGGVHPVSVAASERELIKRAHLVLEEPREETADALASELWTPRL